LRSEKEALATQLETVLAERDAAQKEASAANLQAQKIAQELEDLRSERKQVRTRIEKLLGQMDLLGTG
jgi:FtsZ-binding cell division protein ZapB